MRKFVTVIWLCLLLSVAGCGSNSDRNDVTENTAADTVNTDTNETNEENGMHLYINDVEVPVKWEDNDSVSELAGLISSGPLTVQMSMYGGFEQVGDLGTTVVRNDRQMTTSSGDIVLYSGSNIVIFYGSNSWAYTKLGHIGLSQKETEELLGQGDVKVTLSA